VRVGVSGLDLYVLMWWYRHCCD